MNTSASELLSFIASSPSAFHTVKTVGEMLTAAGYTALCEGAPFVLLPGGKYFVTRNHSSLIAFRIPKSGKLTSFMIAATHSDSPSFKIKHHAESDASGYTRINVERYGGMLCATWLDRPLSAAGRVTLLRDGKITSRLVDLDRDLFLIPSVAIHMNRNANESATYNPATDMQPIIGTSVAKGKLSTLIAEACGAEEKDIVASDLYLYPRTEGRIWGIDNEFVSAPRLDDLQCVFAAVKGFLAADSSEITPVLMIADNEEVGSSTKQGADSTFLADTLMELNEALGGKPTDYRRAVAASFMVSADNAHAVHPNHPEYADPAHRPQINGGIVIKHNASQLYTTDAVSATIFTAICRKAEVPVQHFANRSDLRGGSTLGNISSTQVSLNTVDIGLPQLAMHSSYETAGVLDTEYLTKAMTVLFSSSLNIEADGAYRINTKA